MTKLLENYSRQNLTFPGNLRAGEGLCGQAGRILEPHAKQMLSDHGLDVPLFLWTDRADRAVRFANEIAYPVVAKVVSPALYRKSDHDGVNTCVRNDDELRAAFGRFSRMAGYMGVMVEERYAEGPVVNIGVTRYDYRCGPAIFLERCARGTDAAGRGTRQIAGADISAVRAALMELDVFKGAGEWESGARDWESFNASALEWLLENACRLVMDPAAGVEALILDPVRFTPDRCVALDVRMKRKIAGRPVAKTHEHGYSEVFRGSCFKKRVPRYSEWGNEIKV